MTSRLIKDIDLLYFSRMSAFLIDYYLYSAYNRNTVCFIMDVPAPLIALGVMGLFVGSPSCSMED